MNEKELKLLFCKALKSGHIKNNDLIPSSDVRIVEEAHFRNFDLLIAAITNGMNVGYVHEHNLLVRTQLLERFARSAKCSIDRIRFYPVEIKSDDDMLDDRLPNQIINAIFAFGLSILVLDKNHTKKINSLRLLPTNIITYTGIDDYFEVSSRFDRLVTTSFLNFNKRAIAKMLGMKMASYIGVLLHWSVCFKIGF